MSTWKKILVEGDAVVDNLATADLTQASSSRTYDLDGTANGLTFKDGLVQFTNSSDLARFEVRAPLGIASLKRNASLRLYDSDDSNYVSLIGAGNITQDYTVRFPTAGPTGANQILESDASGSLSWIDTPSGGSSVVTTYTNGVDNRVITSSGADSINGEANLTFSGTTLTVNGKTNLVDTARVTTNNRGFAGTDTSSGVVAIAKVNASDEVEIGDSGNGLLLESSSGPSVAGNANYIYGQTNGGSYTPMLGIDSLDNLRVGGPSVEDISLQNPLVAAPGIRAETTSSTTAGSFGPGAEITYLGSSTTTVNQGRIYYYNGTSWIAYTTAFEGPQQSLLGIALGTTMDKGFLLRGFVRPNSTASFSAGKLVYGAVNAGATTTVPTSGFQRIMGHSVSTAVMYFNPSQEYIDLA